MHPSLVHASSSISAPKLERLHGESEPRSVDAIRRRSWHACAAATVPKLGNLTLLKASPSKPQSGTSSLLMTLSAQRHGDFPRSILGSKLPACELRSRASLPPHLLCHAASIRKLTSQKSTSYSSLPPAKPCPSLDLCTCFAESTLHLTFKEGMGRVSPVLLTPSAGVHGMPVLLQLCPN
eukprot:TRINITY_DN17825_c0_g1_i5.p1 TRINITY_DN17825_c0_g1~~TRINITY_DN17825_c0_g1_i5.p1  ORF type:complete len:180 (+),score=21.56 TRINITY_DN17825_c0_g1_i5:128-667(+)